MSNSDTEKTISDIEEEEPDYIGTLIDRVLCKYENEDEGIDYKEIYNDFRKKAKFYYVYIHLFSLRDNIPYVYINSTLDIIYLS